MPTRASSACRCYRPIAMISKTQINTITPKHRRPDRHHPTLMNPQQYFFGCAIARYRHLSTTIACFSRTHFALAAHTRLERIPKADIAGSAAKVNFGPTSDMLGHWRQLVGLVSGRKPVCRSGESLFDPTEPWAKTLTHEQTNQWLIIQGRAVGNPLAPLFVFVISRAGFFLSEQQPQPGPCDALY